MRIAILATAALLLALPAQAQQAAPQSGLDKLLTAELARFTGPGGPYRGGIYIKHMVTGEEAGVREDEVFESASTIKMVMTVMAYRMAEQKKLNLNERYIVREADYRGGGIIRLSDPDLNPTYRDIIGEMIITSNNTATDIMTAKVGGVDAVKAFLKQEGFNNLSLNFTTYGYFQQRYALTDPKYKAMSSLDFYAIQRNQPTKTMTAEMIKRIQAEAVAAKADERLAELRSDKNYWYGVASPRDMGRLLEGIENATIVSKESADEIKRFMRGQKSGVLKIPHWLDVPVAHKTGEIGGVTNDVGMIYARSGPIIISFYSQGYTGRRAEADSRLGHVARLVLEYFDGAPETRTAN
jgi:beta-lactamase class A